MRQTLAEMRGSILSRVVAPDRVPKGAVDDAINQAQQELHLQARANAQGKPMLSVRTLHIEEGKDTYDLPAEVGDVVKAERRDVLSNTPVVMVPVDYRRDDEPGVAGSLWRVTPRPWSYVIAPNRRLRLMEIPTSAVENGLRLTFIPRPVPLVNLDDVSGLPEEIHECIVAQALARLAQHRDVSFSNPSAVQAFIKRQDGILLDYLTPSELDRPTQVEDRDEFYREI